MKQEKNKQTESRFVRLLAMLILCFCTTQLVFAQTFIIDGINYKINSDGESVSVTYYPNKYSMDISIPDNVTYENITYAVTNIESGAFTNRTEIVSLRLGKSLKTIENQAFYGCTNLNGELIIPDMVTSIGKYAFLGCTSLDSLKLGKSLKTIGERAFLSCYELRSELIIPDMVTSIGVSAFEKLLQS